MKLYDAENSEMLDVSKIDAEGSRLVITGTMMGAMPIEVMLSAAELRKIFPLLSMKVVLAALRMLIIGR
jgi:hypothetical protein